MRLTSKQIAFIKQTVAEHFGPGARVWLFGSRVDDAKRGGDVDLYVEPQSHEDAYVRRLDCFGDLVEGLPYPVDLVVAEPDAPRPIDRIALAQGVLL